EFHIDGRALNGHLLEVPFADGPQIVAVGRDHAVGRAVVLPRIQAGVSWRRVVQYLDLAHAEVGGVAVSRVADGQALVSGRRKAKFDAGDEVGVLVLRIDRPALLRPADDGSVLDFILIDGARPAGEILAVEDVHKASRALAAEDFIGLRRGDRADKQI